MLLIGFLYVFRLGKPSGNDSHTYLFIQNEWSFSCTVPPTPQSLWSGRCLTNLARYVYGANIIDNPAKIKLDSWVVHPKKTGCWLADACGIVGQLQGRINSSKMRLKAWLKALGFPNYSSITWICWVFRYIFKQPKLNDPDEHLFSELLTCCWQGKWNDMEWYGSLCAVLHRSKPR